MGTIECTATLMPDGHLILPPEVVKQLNVHAQTMRRIIILNEKSQKRTLNQFSGQWKDDRDADEILSEIYSAREKNNRSDRVNF
ncbi:MAG: hypothetical protein GY757_38735 [bacterium]|nr:hypothetical protein [bacterium]